MILGLVGNKGCGKTTLATLLDKEHGFVRLSFAEPVRRMLHSLLSYQGCSTGESRELLRGNSKEKETKFLAGRTARWAMQSLGTEWGRDLIDENLWVNAWKHAAENFKSYNIVADDTRFITEEIAIRSLGGKIVLLIRDKHSPGVHLSEREYLQIVPDLTIINDGDPIKMLRAVEDIWISSFQGNAHGDIPISVPQNPDAG